MGLLGDGLVYDNNKVFHAKKRSKDNVREKVCLRAQPDYYQLLALKIGCDILLYIKWQFVLKCTIQYAC